MAINGFDWEKEDSAEDESVWSGSSEDFSYSAHIDCWHYQYGLDSSQDECFLTIIADGAVVHESKSNSIEKSKKEADDWLAKKLS